MEGGARQQLTAARRAGKTAPRFVLSRVPKCEGPGAPGICAGHEKDPLNRLHLRRVPRITLVALYQFCTHSRAGDSPASAPAAGAGRSGRRPDSDAGAAQRHRHQSAPKQRALPEPDGLRPHRFAGADRAAGPHHPLTLGAAGTTAGSISSRPSPARAGWPRWDG